MSKKLTYVKESTVPGLGKGLFAKKDIASGQTICEFTGTVSKYHDEPMVGQVTITFADGYELHCDPDSKANQAQDPIIFQKPGQVKRRRLMESLKNTDKPFYDIHENCTLNSTIFLDNLKHKVFLISESYIKKDDEIFCHFGFPHWFTEELKIGFLKEDEIEQNGFPKTIHQYPAFENYLKKFYKDYLRMKVKVSNKETRIKILLNKGTHVSMSIPNYRDQITRKHI
jgi:hypothetical protein